MSTLPTQSDPPERSSFIVYETTTTTAVASATLREPAEEPVDELGNSAATSPTALVAVLPESPPPIEEPSSTPTATSVPPTATSVPPTATSVPPTATSVPPTATSVPPTNVPPTATDVVPTAAPAATPPPPPADDEVVITVPTAVPLSAEERWRRQQLDRRVLEPARTYTTTGSELWWYDPVQQQHVILGSFAGSFTVQAEFRLRGQGVQALEVPYQVNQSYGVTSLSDALLARIAESGAGEWIETYVFVSPSVRPQ